MVVGGAIWASFCHRFLLQSPIPLPLQFVCVVKKQVKIASGITLHMRPQLPVSHFVDQKLRYKLRANGKCWRPAFTVKHR